MKKMENYEILRLMNKRNANCAGCGRERNPGTMLMWQQAKPSWARGMGRYVCFDCWLLWTAHDYLDEMVSIRWTLPYLIEHRLPAAPLDVMFYGVPETTDTRSYCQAKVRDMLMACKEWRWAVVRNVEEQLRDKDFDFEFDTWEEVMSWANGVALDTLRRVGLTFNLTKTPIDWDRLSECVEEVDDERAA